MAAPTCETALKKTQKFARLFMAPGMWHCNGGPGPNSFGGAIQQPPPIYDAQYDLLTSLTQWVEKGVAPNSVIATKYNNDMPQLGIAPQRPICSYPKIATYNGTGDPNLARASSALRPRRARQIRSRRRSMDRDVPFGMPPEFCWAALSRGCNRFLGKEKSFYRGMRHDLRGRRHQRRQTEPRSLR